MLVIVDDRSTEMSPICRGSIDGLSTSWSGFVDVILDQGLDGLSTSLTGFAEDSFGGSIVTSARAEPESPVRAGPKAPDRSGPGIFASQLRSFVGGHRSLSRGLRPGPPGQFPGDFIRGLFGDNAVSPGRAGPARPGPMEGRPL